MHQFQYEVHQIYHMAHWFQCMTPQQWQCQDSSVGYFDCVSSGPPHPPPPQKKMALALCVSFDLAGLEQNHKDVPLGAGQNIYL